MNSIDDNEFSRIHSNIRGIPANLNGFLCYLSNIDHNFFVIGFSETWLTPSNFDVYGIDGYNHVGLTRKSGREGGVPLLICDKFMYTELPELCIVQDYTECVFVKMCHMPKPWLLEWFTDHHHYIWLHIRKIIDKTKKRDKYKVVRFRNHSWKGQCIEKIQNTAWYRMARSSLLFKVSKHV